MASATAQSVRLVSRSTSGRPIFINMSDPIPPEMWAALVRERKDRVQLIVDRFAEKVAAIERKLERVAKEMRIVDPIAGREHHNWRGFLEAAVGGELSFFEPLSMGLGLAARSPDTHETVIAFTLKLIAERADAARISQYDAAWIGRSLNRFRTIDRNLTLKREAAFAQALRGTPDAMNTQGKARKKTAAEQELDWEEMLRQISGASPGGANSNRDAALQKRFDEALVRLHEATPRPAALAMGLIDAPDGVLEFDENYRGPMVLQPRISDRLTRGEVHLLVADPNVGKTTLTYLLALSIAEANAMLIAQTKIDWCGPVMVVSNEDVAGNGAARWREQRKHLGRRAG